MSMRFKMRMKKARQAHRPKNCVQSAHVKQLNFHKFTSHTNKKLCVCHSLSCAYGLYVHSEMKRVCETVSDWREAYRLYNTQKQVSWKLMHMNRSVHLYHKTENEEWKKKNASNTWTKYTGVREKNESTKIDLSNAVALFFQFHDYCRLHTEFSGFECGVKRFWNRNKWHPNGIKSPRWCINTKS